MLPTSHNKADRKLPCKSARKLLVQDFVYLIRIIRIGFGGIFYYNHNKDPPKNKTLF